MIDYGSAYTASFRLMRVDKATWSDAGEVGGVLTASVNRDRSTRLMESGSLELSSSNLPDGEFWGRIEMLAEQGREAERNAVATLLLTPGRSKARAGGTKGSYDGRSVLAPADDMVTLAGSYAPMGSDGAAFAAALIAECTPAPVTTEGSFTLSDHVVFAQGTTFLEAAWMVLDSAGWCIRINGRGEILVGPMPTEPVLVLDNANSSLLGTEVESDDARSEVPNRYIAVDGDQVAIATDDDPSSPTSTVARGRLVDMYDESPSRVDGESLDAYANRRLAEETSVLGKRSYQREWQPGVLPYDIVRGAVTRAGLVGDMRVLSQSMSVGGAMGMVDEVSEVLR